MNNLCFHDFWTNRATVFEQAMVTQDHMAKDNDFFFLVINLQLLQDLGNFFIDECNVADEVASNSVFCILRPRQLDHFGQIV